MRKNVIFFKKNAKNKKHTVHSLPVDLQQCLGGGIGAGPVNEIVGRWNDTIDIQQHRMVPFCADLVQFLSHMVSKNQI